MMTEDLDRLIEKASDELEASLKIAFEESGEHLGACIASAIHDNFTSPNATDRNFEAANVVDGLYEVSRGLHHIARALEGIRPEYTDDQLRRYQVTPNRFRQGAPDAATELP